MHASIQRHSVCVQEATAPLNGLKISSLYLILSLPTPPSDQSQSLKQISLEDKHITLVPTRELAFLLYDAELMRWAKMERCMAVGCFALLLHSLFPLNRVLLDTRQIRVVEHNVRVSVLYQTRNGPSCSVWSLTAPVCAPPSLPVSSHSSHHHFIGSGRYYIQTGCKQDHLHFCIDRTCAESSLKPTDVNSVL
jgi:hypothetical protein